MFERDMEEGGPRLGEEVVAVAKLSVHMDPSSPPVGDPRAERQPAVDEDRLPVPDEHPRGHGREPVPGGEEPACLVQRRADEPAVHNARAGLMPLPEGERRLITLDPLLGRDGQVNTVLVVSAAPTSGVVVRRDSLASRAPFPTVQRSPPRSKCAL
jgi:hypothetical protein